MEVGRFDYSQEGGSFDTAQEVADLALKATAELTLTDAEVVAKTIAHWLRLSRPQLADVPALHDGAAAAYLRRASPHRGPGHRR